MRTVLPLLCLVFVLSATAPAQAQLRETAQESRSVQTQLYDRGSDLSNAISSLFGAEEFHMSHSYSASFSSFGGRTSSVGAYTNSMMWKFNSAWDARMDVTVAHPLGANSFGANQDPQVYLRNAEVTYQPSENLQFRVQVQQNPHGRYASPHGFAPRRGLHGSTLFRRN